jgi:hypothetical protein
MRPLALVGIIGFVLFIWFAITYTNVHNQGVMTLLGGIVGLVCGVLIFLRVGSNR